MQHDPLGDARKITQDFPYIKPRSMLDLGFLARVVDPENCGDGKGLISLARLTRGYLEHDLNKDNGVRKSDWSLALTPEQQECECVEHTNFGDPRSHRHVYSAQMRPMTS